MGQPKSPKEIGLAVEVSDGTIRTAYKLMHLEQDKLIKEEWIAKGGDRSRIPQA
jgi:transcription initiation factor TFIIB